MADKRISELVDAGALTGTEEIAIVQGGVTKRATLAELLGIGAFQALDGDLLTVGEGTHRRLDITAGVSVPTERLALTYFTARSSAAAASARVYVQTPAAAATPSLVRIGIWTTDGTGALLALVASTPNDTALLNSTFSGFTKAFSAAWNKVAGTRYAAGLLVVTAAAAPTVYATNATPLGGIMSASPRLSATVAAQTDLPATLAAGSLGLATVSTPYFEFLP